MEAASVPPYSLVNLMGRCAILRGSAPQEWFPWGDSLTRVKEKVVISSQDAAWMIIFSLLIQKIISVSFMAGPVLAQLYVFLFFMTSILQIAVFFYVLSLLVAN